VVIDDAMDGSYVVQISHTGYLDESQDFSLFITGDTTEYTVAPDGSGNYPTIQAAIDAAEDGDTILLADGIYAGVGNMNINLGSKNLVLRSISDDPKSCVIAVEPEPAGHFWGIRINGGQTLGTRIQGITVRGARAPSGRRNRHKRRISNHP